MGRPGEGPGKLGGQVFGVAVRDQLWLVDPRNARLSVFEVGSLVRDRLPGRIFAVARSVKGDGILVSGFLAAGGNQYRLARITLDPDADVYGGVPEEHPNPRVAIHMPAETKDGEVWTFAIVGGAVNVLNAADLSLVERWRLPGAKFGRVGEEGRPNRSGERAPPTPHLAGVMTDDDGLI